MTCYYLLVRKNKHSIASVSAHVFVLKNNEGN
jgi:hypothetical protein